MIKKTLLTSFLIVATSLTAAAERPMVLERTKDRNTSRSISYNLRLEDGSIGHLYANCAIPMARISYPSGSFTFNYESIEQNGRIYNAFYLTDKRGNQFSRKNKVGKAHSIIDMVCTPEGWPKPYRSIYIRKSDLPYEAKR